ncbi:uncharacterized protein A4U43_C06F12830 [Asparagus officinalis]|uniref:Uncharacterized protein n=1 Tax=Asparagus officinalis TaxID=4686 RepID=A0A5P1ELI6_ASPOF|nr:uncharacterized protein A4U43_C06F12830 [Asparagus officinalis]
MLIINIDFDKADLYRAVVAGKETRKIGPALRRLRILSSAAARRLGLSARLPGERDQRGTGQGGLSTGVERFDGIWKVSARLGLDEEGEARRAWFVEEMGCGRLTAVDGASRRRWGSSAGAPRLGKKRDRRAGVKRVLQRRARLSAPGERDERGIGTRSAMRKREVRRDLLRGGWVSSRVAGVGHARSWSRSGWCSAWGGSKGEGDVEG